MSSKTQTLTDLSNPAGRTGVLCVVSGPSGSGKTTLCRALSDRDPNVVYSVSCTTRPPRPGERDGSDYIFLSEDDFEAKAAAGEFLEHATVHGRRYGTLRGWVLERLAAGTDVVMDLDVQGAAQVRACGDPDIRRAATDVFLLLPDMGELEARLSGRATESAAELELRLRNALAEMARWREYGYTIVSGSREDDLVQFAALVAAERLRTGRLPEGLFRGN